MSETIKQAGGPHFFVSPEGDLYGEDSPENRETAKRIRACVNACEGISTEELENGIIQDLQQAIGAIVPLLQDKKEELEKVVGKLPTALDAAKSRSMPVMTVKKDSAPH